MAPYAAYYAAYDAAYDAAYYAAYYAAYPRRDVPRPQRREVEISTTRELLLELELEMQSRLDPESRLLRRLLGGSSGGAAAAAAARRRAGTARRPQEAPHLRDKLLQGLELCDRGAVGCLRRPPRHPA